MIYSKNEKSYNGFRVGRKSCMSRMQLNDQNLTSWV